MSLSGKEVIGRKRDRLYAAGAAGLFIASSLVACESADKNEVPEPAPETSTSAEADPVVQNGPTTPAEADPTTPAETETPTAKSAQPEEPSAEETTPTPDSLPTVEADNSDYPSSLSPEALAELKANSYGGAYDDEHDHDYIPTAQQFEGAISMDEVMNLSDEELLELGEQGVCLPGWENCTPEQFGQQMPQKLQNRYNDLSQKQKEELISSTAGDPKFPTIEFELRVIESMLIEDHEGNLLGFQSFYPNQCSLYDRGDGMMIDGLCDLYDPSKIETTENGYQRVVIRDS